MADAQTEPSPCPSGPSAPWAPLAAPPPKLSFLSSTPQRSSSHSHLLLLPFPILAADKYFSPPSLAACHGLGESPCSPARFLLAFCPSPNASFFPCQRPEQGGIRSPTASPVTEITAMRYPQRAARLPPTTPSQGWEALCGSGDGCNAALPSVGAGGRREDGWRGFAHPPMPSAPSLPLLGSACLPRVAPLPPPALQWAGSLSHPGGSQQLSRGLQLRLSHVRGWWRRRAGRGERFILYMNDF